MAQDLHARVHQEVSISSKDQRHIDINLSWAYQCIEQQTKCSVENEKKSIKKTLQNLQEMQKKYLAIDTENQTLSYILSQFEMLYDMTQKDVPPM